MDKNGLLKTGQVYFIDLSDHRGISQRTMKDPHYVTIITNNRFLSSPNVPYAICVPMTSFDLDSHWDKSKERLKFNFHHLIYKKKYPLLERDTIIKCDQIFTIDREYFNNYQFCLDEADITEVRKRVAFVLGYSSF